MSPSTILTINTGSSSVRLAAFTAVQDELLPLASQHYKPEERTPEELLHEFLRAHDLKNIVAVAHRVVHGGARFTATTRLDAETESAIDELSHLAPLHNPRALRWMAAARAVLEEEVLQVAVFDTAFYQ